MSVRRSRSLTLLLLAASFAAFVLTGCGSPCACTCTPRGPWQSPTIRATRALLLITTEELRILRVDGKSVRPSCLWEGRVREYHLPVGEHTITASFRYAAPRSAGLLGDVRGLPLAVDHPFVAGHEYVAVYREHPYPRPEAPRQIADVVSNVHLPEDRYWSLEFTDLADIEPDPGPPVEEALRHVSWVRGATETSDPGEAPSGW